MHSTVEDLVRDISALDLEKDKFADDPHQQSQSHHNESQQSGQSRAMQRAQSAATKRKNRPVLETYNSRQNQNKFCIPIGLDSATNLDETFARERRMKAAIKAQKARHQTVGKKITDQLNACARRKWGTDTRFQGKFVDLAHRV